MEGNERLIRLEEKMDRVLESIQKLENLFSEISTFKVDFATCKMKQAEYEKRISRLEKIIWWVVVFVFMWVWTALLTLVLK